MKLVIAEKPSVARSIADVLGASNKKDGYIEGNGYIITWCVGHLVGLATPEMYDEIYAKWNYDHLPILPSPWKYQVKDKTKKRFKIIKDLMHDDRVTSLVEATDSGREGELIFRLVYDKVVCTKPFERLWISSMEDSAIKAGFNDLRKGSDYENLYQSALARSHADWIVGLNATRLFTTKYNAKLSVGRVQTPTLAMIVEHDMKITNFIKEKFYHVNLDLGTFSVKSDRIDTIELADKIITDCKDRQAVISEVIKDVKKNKAPKLFDLTTLQREANRYYSYTAKQTLDYAQSLYEKKLITYPRTDSRFITTDMRESVSDLVSRMDLVDTPNVDRLINDSKVSDHHAIIPTTSSLNMDETKIPVSELSILKLIRMKLTTAVSLDYVYEEVSVSVLVNNHDFKAKEKTCIEMGFKAVEDEFKISINDNDKLRDKSDAVKLIKINQGDKYSIVDIKRSEHFTSPPKHYTEDTLLSAMERAGVEELDNSLEVEKKGLGTPATRAGIIERLIQVGYIERKKKNILSTSKGVELIKIVPERIKSPTLTAEWENRLTEISNGSFNADQFMGEIKLEIKELVKSYSDMAVTSTFESTKEVIGKCPRCESDVYESKSNFYCSSKDCKFSIWKEDKFFLSKKKKVTKTIAKGLLTKGKIKVKGLYSEKKDKTYDATVVLNDTGTWVNYKLEFK
ncbi:DNA topoisomerase III [Acidaminobacter sp. JC074]|uniref:type IA DNA topoisomerase n=1 Tax=Acidaminobacter sp. JC074 TaxID=2530199 RepID=UPI001F11857B|nr:DNA topoisomerase 3 [Acidaminobacter sp. JC074]MCH4888936.1 DNA topoisomerase III [Acidaminobacter sp. JC074]